MDYLQHQLNTNIYDVKMQQSDNEKFFTKVSGELFKEIRKEGSKNSLNKFAREYDIDRGNLSKIERGLLSCRLLTAWKIAEASGIKFSDFALRLEKKLGQNFKLIDE